MGTIVTLSTEDITEGMTVAFSLDGTHRARRVESIDRTDTVTVLWLAEDFGLAVPTGSPVSVEIH